mgnify:CR=1 FL=1
MPSGSAPVRAPCGVRLCRVRASAWRRVPHRLRLSPVDASRLQRRLEQQEQPLLVAVSAGFRRDQSMSSLLEGLEMSDPRLLRSMSVLSLFEQQQERLQPMPEEEARRGDGGSEGGAVVK